MNTSLFGTWEQPRLIGDYLSERVQGLFHALAAQSVGTPQFQANSGMSQKKDQFCMLATLVNFLRPKVLMEVGVAQGGTLAAWCQLAPPDATIIALDKDLNDARPRPGDPVHSSIYNGPLEMTSQGGGIYHLAQRGQTMIGINGWTHDPKVQEEVKRHLNGRTIDFCFHDASHSARMTREDMVWIWPLISPGGMLALHDIQPSVHPECNKSAAWQEMKDTLDYSARYEFCGSRHDDSMGIGILVKA
jgi:predicted O-methyltransferase YrrM